jgi:IS1 family transposase
MALREKKQQWCQTHERDEAGDMWDHTAVAADRKLIALVVGKRTHEHTNALVHDTKSRLRPGHLPAIFTEAYASYESAIFAACGRRYLTPRHSATGRTARSQLRWPQGLAYGPVKKISTKGHVERVDVRVIRGKARLQQVLYLLGDKQSNTSVVERHNGTSRLRNRRKVRQTLTFSKAQRYHRWMRWLSGGLDNFCRAHSSLQVKEDAQIHHRSPAMVARLTDHIWLTREWLVCPVLGGQG